MSDTLTVRDHTQPCEHEGRGTVQFDRGAFVSGGNYQCNVTACPGGREIVLLEVSDEYLAIQLHGQHVWVEVEHE